VIILRVQTHLADEGRKAQDRECRGRAARATRSALQAVLPVGLPVAELPTFMNSGGSIKGLLTIYIAH
jgi:hypothetical protein